MPPQQLITLETAPHIILCPLYFVAMYKQFVVCFAITEHDEETHEFRRICCLRPDPLIYEPLSKRPLLFEVIGQISEIDCYLTARGNEDNQEEDDPFASCWVEPRPDHVSRIYWRSLLPALDTIMDAIPGAVDCTKLVRGQADNVGTVALQVLWRPLEGESITDSLPFYRPDGIRYVPANRKEVPFGCALRFVFTLEYYHQRNNPRSRVMFANLAHIVHL